jgi:signal transduction histidine kinase/DNA-binding response OmpR family regulator
MCSPRFFVGFILLLWLALPVLGQDGALVLSDSGYVDFGDPGDAFDMVPGEERTFAFWMRYDKTTYHAKLLDKRARAGPTDEHLLEGFTTYVHQFVGTAGVFLDPANYPDRGVAGAAGLRVVADGQWHHVAYVQAGSVVRIYVDGRFDTSFPLRSGARPITNDAPLWFGWNGLDRIHYTGAVDELTIWSRALEAEDLRRLMYAPPAPSAPGLTAHYPLDEVGPAGCVLDSGPNAYHGRAYHVDVIPASRLGGPKWTETWVFSVLLGALGLGLLYALLRAYAWRIERKRRHLQRVVDERTEELSFAFAQVEDQARQLREVNEGQNRFFASISHEFRTPLTLALGLVGDALRGRHGALSAGLRSDLAKAHHQNRLLLRLVNQLLDLARLEAGSLTLHVRPVDLAAQVDTVAGAFAPHAERSGVAFERGMSATGQVWADAEQWELVATNLLSNAFKFTPRGGRVAVRLRVGRGETSLEVEDTGEGIAAEDLPHIFDRFYRADRSHQRVGTGVGLATVKEVVDLMGGAIHVESTLGEGTIFHVRLPTSREHYEQNERAALVDEPYRSGGEYGDGVASAEVPSVAGAADDAGRLAHEVNGEANGEADEEQDRTTVLVVDDNADVRSYVRRHLAPHYRVEEAEDGAEALKAARALTPDLIVSDVMMPRMDGFALVEAIRADDDLAFVPLILLTARAEAEDRLAGLSKGADDYLEKPFEPQELVLRVRNAIASRHRLRQHLATKPAPATPRAAAEALAENEKAEEKTSSLFADQARRVVLEHLGADGFGVEALAGALAMERTTLYRRLGEATGQTPTQFVRETRLGEAERMLREGSGTVCEVAYAVGFKSTSYFARRFKERYGATPAAYAAEA